MSKTAIFTMGLPAAGKSSVLALRNVQHVIDPDAIKASHPDYDPKNPAALHVWSKAEAEVEFACALQASYRFALDGTGTNVDVLIANMRRAKVAGFTVHLLHVAVSLETALERNAKRERTVPEQVLREKAETIWVAFELAAKEADEVEVVWNE